ncbi:MAG TPA: hypothetical protein VK537_05085, partial [Galbitalea sp.]|nr:hypothetical protein [Galbitalea sp.]
GLHDELADEASNHQSDVTVVTDLLDLLESLRDASGNEVGEDIDVSLKILEEEFRNGIDNLLEADGLVSRGTAREKSIEPFATPDPDTVAVILRAEYDLGVLDDPDFVFADEATVDASGSGFIGLAQQPEHSTSVSVDYMETVLSTPHGDIVRDWDFGLHEDLPRPRRLSSLFPDELQSRIEQLHRGRGRGRGRGGDGRSGGGGGRT